MIVSFFFFSDHCTNTQYPANATFFALSSTRSLIFGPPPVQDCVFLFFFFSFFQQPLHNTTANATALSSTRSSHFRLFASCLPFRSMCLCVCVCVCVYTHTHTHTNTHTHTHTHTQTHTHTHILPRS